jgi:hypothetical protein
MRSPSMRSTVSTASCSARRVVGSAVVGTDLGDVARRAAPGRAPAAPGRRSCRSPRLGQLDAGEVLDLVGAQQPGERPGAVAPLADHGRRGGRARRRCRRRSPRRRPRGSRCRRGRRTRRARPRAGSRPAQQRRAAGRASESGTTIGLTMRCLTRVVAARGTGSATACLTCTVPTTSSSSSSTGNREWPVWPGQLDDRERTVGGLEAVHPHPGVMISPAVREPNSTERSISSAVSASRVPWSAERWISEASSAELRAERSSSCGSMPSRRTTALAEPLSSRIGRRIDRGEAALEALRGARVSSGLASARFLGTSSPKIIVSACRAPGRGRRAIGVDHASPARRPPPAGRRRGRRWPARPGSRSPGW